MEKGGIIFFPLIDAGQGAQLNAETVTGTDIRACTYTHTHKHTRTRTRTLAHAHAHAFTHTHTHTWTRAHTRTRMKGPLTVRGTPGGTEECDWQPRRHVQLHARRADAWMMSENHCRAGDKGREGERERGREGGRERETERRRDGETERRRGRETGRQGDKETTHRGGGGRG
jgi:hypothetical protein